MFFTASIAAAPAPSRWRWNACGVTYAAREVGSVITDKITKENAAKLIGSRWPLKTDATRVLRYSRIIDTEEYAVYERPVKADMVVAE